MVPCYAIKQKHSLASSFFVFLGGNMRKFEKISFDQFKKDIEDNIDLYEKYKLPSRATKLSAGYDFYSLYDLL